MGILADILKVRDAPVTNINGLIGPVTIAATPPLAWSSLGQVLTAALVVPGVGRGHLLQYGVSSWGSIAPPSDQMSVLMGNGAGAANSWVQVEAGTGIALNRVGNVLTISAL